MPSMTPMMSAIFLDDELISSIVATTCETTAPPRRATCVAELASWLAWAAASALWRTLPVSCDSELAVCCRLLAVCSVRWLRSWLPVAISEDAVDTSCVPERIEPMVLRVSSCSTFSARRAAVDSALPTMRMSVARLPWLIAMVWRVKSPTMPRTIFSETMNSPAASATSVTPQVMITPADQPKLRPTATTIWLPASSEKSNAARTLVGRLFSMESRFFCEVACGVFA